MELSEFALCKGCEQEDEIYYTSINCNETVGIIFRRMRNPPSGNRGQTKEKPWGNREKTVRKL